MLPKKNVETSIVATKLDDKNVQVSTFTRVWPIYSYFNQQPSDFNLKKNSYPENSIVYINEAYLIIKHNKIIFYGDHFLFGQIIEAINSPENISNYVCMERIVKMYRPRYDTGTGEFLRLDETIGYLIVRGNDDENFLNYGYCEESSKILYSHHKQRIPNYFAATLFNRHCLVFENGQLQTDFSNLHYFLASTTDRSKAINQHMNFVNLTPIDIPEKIAIEDNIVFDQDQNLTFLVTKKIDDKVCHNNVKKIADISISSIVKNPSRWRYKG